MEAEKKLQGANYHLDRMKELYLKDEEHFTHELEAFLANIRSVLDVMLEDFNVRFNLGISLKENLYSDTFEKRANRLSNQKAIAFIAWWKGKMAFINSSYVGPLFEKRKISIHRKTVTADYKKITAFAKIDCFAKIKVLDKDGNLVSESSAKRPESKQEPSKVEWSFKEYPQDNALDVSKKLFDEIEIIVNEAKLKF